MKIWQLLAVEAVEINTQCKNLKIGQLSAVEAVDNFYRQYKVRQLSAVEAVDNSYPVYGSCRQLKQLKISTQCQKFGIWAVLGS